MKPVLVTGATGKVGGTGRHLAQMLLERGAPVRAVVHKEDERSQVLAKAGAEIVCADFLDEDAIRCAMEGVGVAYFCAPVFDVLLRATTVFALCARDCGVERIINLSQWGTKDPILSEATRLHRLGEMIFDWAGTPTSHLRPAMFMEQLVMVFSTGVRTKSTLVAPFNDERVNMIAAVDVSRVAAEIALDPKRHGPGPYELTGPANFTLHDVASTLAAELGRPVKYVNVDPVAWKKGALEWMPPHLAGHLEKLYEKGRLGRLNYGPTPVVHAVTGKPPTTLKEFFREHRAPFA